MKNSEKKDMYVLCLNTNVDNVSLLKLATEDNFCDRCMDRASTNKVESCSSPKLSP